MLGFYSWLILAYWTVFKHLLYTSLCVKCWKYSEKIWTHYLPSWTFMVPLRKWIIGHNKTFLEGKLWQCVSQQLAKNRFSFWGQKNTSFHLLMFPSLPEEISWCNTQHVSICFISVAGIVCLHACSPFFLHPVSPVGRGQQTSAASCLLCPSLWGFKRLLLLHSSSWCYVILGRLCPLERPIDCSSAWGRVDEPIWFWGAKLETHNWFMFKPHSFITIQGIITDILIPMQLYFSCHFFS